MKLLIASDEGEAYFNLLDTVPGLEVAIAKTAGAMQAQAASTEVLYGRPTATFLAAAGKLRWVQTPSAGVDFIHKLPELVESDVIVTNTRGAHAPSIAEHTFGMLLAMTRALVPASIDWQRQKYWGRDPGYRMPKELLGSTIGIVGYGQIGRAIAQRAAGFGMRVLAVDVAGGSGAPYVETVWPVSQLLDMMAESHVVAIAAPLTPDTHHLIDAAALAAMPAGGYLIAVSRGGIVDETALIASLQAGHLAGVGLDVCEQEPLPPDSPLWTLPQVLISPHLAGSSPQKERRCVEILVDNLKRFSRGEPLTNVVDKRLGY